MGIPTLSLCAILAIVPLLWLPELPARHTLWIMVAAGWCWAYSEASV